MVEDDIEPDDTDPFVAEVTAFDMEKKLPLVNKNGLYLPTYWINKYVIPVIPTFAGNFIRGLDMPLIVRKGLDYVVQNPQLFVDTLPYSGLTVAGSVAWIVKKYRDNEQMLNRERGTLYPQFLNKRNKEISNFEYATVCWNQRFTSFPLDRNAISLKTNIEVEQAITGKYQEELHTFRVLFRAQDQLLDLLRSYDTKKNHIYFTDAESEALLILSIAEAETAKGIRRATRDPDSKIKEEITEKIHVAGKSYYSNRDLFYMIQLVDQACSLSVLKSQKNTKVYAMKNKEHQDIRATCFGPLEDPRELHLVAFPKGHPGAYGKLLVNRRWGRYMKDAVEKLDPEEIDVNKAALNVIRNHLNPFYEKIVKEYTPFKRVGFPNLARFVSAISNWSPKKVIRFVKDESKDAFNRKAIQDELRHLDLMDLDNRILQ
jgi:hypothetical protein